MIKRIELINFMSHTHTVIEPAAGLTVLVGPNNCGKSAVMSALQILSHNDTSTYVTRHGEKECTILVETQEGDIIQWSRNKTSSKYSINGETFDRLRGTVPPKLLEVLKLPKVQLDQSKDEFDIHFGNQKDPVFLINESGRAAAGFFAASSDASRLLEMQKLHSQNVKESSRDSKRLAEEAEELERNIERLQFVPDLKSRFENCNQLVKSIELHDQAISELNSLKKQVNAESLNSRILGHQNKVVQGLAKPPVIHATNSLADLLNNIVNLQTGSLKLNSVRNSYRPLNPPPDLFETNGLNALIAELKSQNIQFNAAKKRAKILHKTTPPPIQTNQTPLQSLITEIKSCIQSIEKYDSTKTNLEQSTSLLEEQLESFVAENPNCPTCHQPLSKQHLKHHTSGDHRGN